MRTPLLLLSAALLFSSCKKDKDDAPAAIYGVPLQMYGVPIPGIFTWLDDTNTLGYLETDDQGGFVSKGYTGSNYSMSALAEEANCRIEMIGKDLDNGPVIYGVRMTSTEEWWIPVLQSGDLMLEQVDLDMTSLPDFGGNWCWIRHDKGTIDGHHVYAMESYTNPGLFWSIQGSLSNADLIRLTPHTDPANAQGFIFR